MTLFRIMTISAALAWPLGVAHAAEVQKGLTNLLAALSKAQTVMPLGPESTAPTNLVWLTGRWECVDRALRNPPPNHCAYAFVQSMNFREDDMLMTRSLPPRFQMYVTCSFVHHGKQLQQTNRIVVVDFDARAFRFDMPDPDFLFLKSEPVGKPDWLILEHQDNGDILLFRRVEPADPKETGT